MSAGGQGRNQRSIPPEFTYAGAVGLLLRFHDNSHKVLLMVQERKEKPQRALRSSFSCEEVLFCPNQGGFSESDVMLTDVRGPALARCTFV